MAAGHAYTSLRADGSGSRTSGYLTVLRSKRLFLLLIPAVITLGWWFLSTGTTSLFRQSPWVKSTLTPSRHRETVSVIMLVGDNDHNILDVTHSVLDMTVGPYELIAVFTGPQDYSQGVVDTQLQRHMEADVDYPGRGLLRYHSVDAVGVSDTAVNVGMRYVKGEYVIVLNGNDQLDEYGWDRVLVMGIKSSPELLAVSGRAASDIHIDSSSISFTASVGHVEAGENHLEHASPPDLHVRDVAMRSPIIYSKVKLDQMGGFRNDFEEVGLGDVDLCIRANDVHNWRCAYFPTSTKSYQHWRSPPGAPNFEPDGTFTPGQRHLLSGYEMKERRPSADRRIKAIERRPEDIPKTIVTGFSANHQHTAQGLYNSLSWAPHTRFVVYLMKSEQQIDMPMLNSWKDVEIRWFDFSAFPDWMDIDQARGEYAWKPKIIEQVVNEFGGLVLWLDAGDLFKEPADDGMWSEIATTGAWSTDTGPQLTDWTHPAMLAYFDIPQFLYTHRNCNGAMVGFNAQNAGGMNKVARPWFECAGIRDCIAPKGSGRHNHRQDQAAFTCLMIKNGYTCERPAPVHMTGGHAEGEG